MKSLRHYISTFFLVVRHYNSMFFTSVTRLRFIRRKRFKKKQKIYRVQGRLDYIYDENTYKESFLINISGYKCSDLSVAPKKVYCFWTGKNSMTKNRLAGLKSIKKKLGVEIVLITPDNVEGFILPHQKFHDAYPYLSLVHKSDYLRCYFMHFYGGGFADIKRFYFSWTKLFDLLNESDKYCIGYQEINEYTIAQVSDKSLLKDLRNHFPLLLGNGAYIFKPGTPFTQDWLTELNRRLDDFLPALKERKDKEYPIPYTNLLGEIFHPLCLKYSDKILIDDDLKPSFANYK